MRGLISRSRLSSNNINRRQRPDQLQASLPTRLCLSSPALTVMPRLGAGKRSRHTKIFTPLTPLPRLLPKSFPWACTSARPARQSSHSWQSCRNTRSSILSRGLMSAATAAKAFSTNQGCGSTRRSTLLISPTAVLTVAKPSCLPPTYESTYGLT